MDALYKTKTVFHFPNPEKVTSEAGCEGNFKPWPVVWAILKTYKNSEGIFRTLVQLNQREFVKGKANPAKGRGGP